MLPLAGQRCWGLLAVFWSDVLADEHELDLLIHIINIIKWFYSYSIYTILLYLLWHKEGNLIAFSIKTTVNYMQMHILSGIHRYLKKIKCKFKLLQCFITGQYAVRDQDGGHHQQKWGIVEIWSSLSSGSLSVTKFFSYLILSERLCMFSQWIIVNNQGFTTGLKAICG